MIPRAAEIETRLLEHCGNGLVHYTRQVIQKLADHFKLTPHDLAESDGLHLRFAHKVHSALARHRRLGLLVRLKRGSFRYMREKVANYEHHHSPRVPKVGKSHHHETTALENFQFRDRTTRALKLDEHDIVLVANVKAALDAAIGV
jgi:restriction endonuclease Mrr